MPLNKMPKMPKQFCCEKCDFSSNKNSNYDIHMSTDKHKILQNPTLKNAKEYSCHCGKKYKHSSTLYAHQKRCSQETPKTDSISLMVFEIVKQNKELIEQTSDSQKQNQEIQKQMLEFCEVMKNNTIATSNVVNNNTINNNCNNKSFNLNVFLNETCKDAMNMKDFVDSIQITLTDIENMGKLGFVNGISNIIVNRLKAIDVHLRPVHCTDQRRETMYVKEKNQWNKEEDDNKNIRRFIQLVAHKNTKNLSLFKNKHPDC